MISRLIGKAAAALLIFAVGVGAGTYYHTELLVLWRAYVLAPRQAEPVPASPEPQVKGAAEAQHTSTLLLDQLPEPLPLVYSETLEEERLQEYLKEGAVVLPLGTSFGEPGNVVITAHSSGTAAFGPFRFAFAKLGELEASQQFRVSTPTATYTYRVYGKEIVWPHQVDKLPNDDRSTVTLVTCWPLWTNFKRLLVHAELVRVENQI